MSSQNFDDAYDHLKALIEFDRKTGQQAAERNEATTRLHLINRLFLECLGWEHQDCVTEETHDGKYADYIFSITTKALIVEAKREGTSFELPPGVGFGEASLTALIKSDKALKKAIYQVAEYCQRRGVPAAAVSNGHQLVAFIAVRTDGRPPLKGKALVFPSLSSMKENFGELWATLSRAGIAEKRLQKRLLGTGPKPLPPKLATKIADYPGSKQRNVFQTDLQIASEMILEDLMRNPKTEDEFLRECYAKSGALSQYALISKKILRARYEALSQVPGAPSLVPAVDKKAQISADLMADSLSRRPILLIGDVGVGKTTFIKHLVGVEAKDLFSEAVSLYIDLGSQGALASILSKFVIDEIDRQLHEEYDVDTVSDNIVRGVYHSEIARFRRGIHRSLKEDDPKTFKAKEIAYLEELVNAKDQHLAKVVEHLQEARRQQVIVFLDNVDQREHQTQQDAFLIAEELAAGWPATIFLALRPETFYRSLKSGTLSGYHPKAFTISPPRIDRVIKMRLDFGLKLARGEVAVEGLHSSVAVQFRRLASIIKVFQMSLVHQEELIEAIDNISSGNIRRGLDLVRDFFGSGHVDTAKISEIYESTGRYYVPLHEFMRAVALGDHAYYSPDRSPIANLFDTGSPDPKEHFLLAIMLQAASSLSRADKHGFVERQEVASYCQDLGFLPVQIDYSMSRGLDKGLIERGREDLEVIDATAIRLTPNGAFHLKKLIGRFFYLDLIIVDTPILEQRFRDAIHDATSIHDRLRRSLQFVDYLDFAWESAEVSDEALAWERISETLRRGIHDIAGKVDTDLERHSR